MISFPEQLSAAQHARFDTQVDFMRELTAQAFATASQVLALNISTSRASAERAANTMRRLVSITDPRDLFALGAQTQEELSAMFNYGRDLFIIASGAGAGLARADADRPAPQPEPEPKPEQTAPVQPASADEKPRAAKAKAPRKLAPVEDKTASVPRAKAKPIAKAVSKATGAAVELPHPAAADVSTADAAGARLLDAVPPSADVLELKQPAAPKAQRKK